MLLEHSTQLQRIIHHCKVQARQPAMMLDQSSIFLIQMLFELDVCHANKEKQDEREGETREREIGSFLTR